MLALAAWALAAPALAAADGTSSNAWSRLERQSGGPAQAIGGTTDGCLAGAVQLPLDGRGYEVIRLSRRRYFGHDDTVDFVEGLGRQAQAAGLPIFYVGDMAQPRGGPLPFGHASHQTGLDVDIWFTLDTKPGLTPDEREDPELPKMIVQNVAQIDPTHFGCRQVRLLELAASDPRVDRIFVNPVIKLALCRGYGDAAEAGLGWLHKLRPWWGHDDHFHVRLLCPRNSPDCEPQAPVPDGDGCDAALEEWTHHLSLPKQAAKPRIERTLPAACERLLAQQ